MLLYFLGIFFFFVLLSVPIAFAIGLTSLSIIHIKGTLPTTLVTQTLLTGVDNFSLLAIPFFMLAGEIMNAGGITRRIVQFANSLVGHIKGGLAQVNIIGSMFFAGISGSAVADASALGGILIPAMTQRGYHKDFAAGVTAGAAVIGPIIPPSIPMVVYGVTAGVSIGKLFLAGFIPGVLIGVGQMVVAYLIARKRGYAAEPRASFGQIVKSFGETFLALLMPVIILGGILGGIFTATEASVVAAVYALIVAVFVYREVKIPELYQVFLNAATTTATILIIVGAAAGLGWVLASEQVPQQLAQSILGISKNPLVILLIINILLLIVGCVMETTAAIIVLTPVLLPLVKQVGIDPIHFGAIMVVNLGIGLITPPVGVVLFIASGISKLRLTAVTKGVLPFMAVIGVVLVIVTYFPKLILYLPSLIK